MWLFRRFTRRLSGPMTANTVTYEDREIVMEVKAYRKDASKEGYLFLC